MDIRTTYETQVFAVFSDDNIRRYDSFSAAQAANPLFIVTTQRIDGEKTWAGQNRRIQYEIFDITGNPSGFAMGKWKTSAVWTTNMAFIPDFISCDIIDPHGCIRAKGFRSRNPAVESISKYLLPMMREVSSCDGWDSYDIIQENKVLKKIIATLNQELFQLKNK
ncbi:hypothetical protein [Hymenobacter actinosclerus]|uniref:hypothetical protein n=1 Tax=Hymenobacter actinosclerus TaxID=82805 RepID=UPI001160B98B|nr:hypothetical protein [Hymenobacter actinosclerus]